MSDYVPKHDPDNINSSDEQSNFRDALILIAGFLVLIVVVVASAGWVTEKIVSRISIENEIKFLGRFTGDDSNKKPLLFVDIEKQLQRHISFPVHINVICEKEPNAFAFPGGKITVTSGLVENIKSENGLMFVLGHEIGHFVNRDHLQGFGRQLALAALMGMFGFSDSSWVVNIGQAPMRTFQREQELEADDYGLKLLNKIYGHTEGAGEFFEHMKKTETGTEKVLASLFSTHPPSEERLEQLKSKSKSKGDVKPISVVALNELGCK